MDGADDGVFGLDLDGDVFEATTRERDVDEEKKSAFSEDKKRQFWLAKRRRQREKVKESKETLSKEEKTQSYRTKQKWKNVPLSQIEFHLPKVCLDADYEAHLTDKEITSVGSQLMYTYGFIKRSERPLYLHVTSFDGKLQSRMSDFGGFNTWKIFLHKEPYYEVFDTSQIVYLSPESENVLEDVDDDHVYIIGAIADHNRLKGLSYNAAQAAGVYSARLPIDQYLSEVANVSLNINHVVEILANYRILKDWREALLKSIPTRKAYQKESKQ